MNWKVTIALFAVGVSALAIAQTTIGPVIVTAPPPPTTLPPVVVTAPRVGGGTIICRGMGCAGVILAMQEEKQQYYMTMQLPAPPLENIELSSAQFCAKLKVKRPANCNLSSPPSSPGITVPGMAPWQPNGCGTGGVGDWFQDFILERIAGQAYSGNLNAPYAGVSFQGACDSHDQCWASGKNRAACDVAFQSSMNTGCSQVGDSNSQATCIGFASLYHGAVSVTNGSNNAYASSVANRACAVWSNDMRGNNCGN